MVGVRERRTGGHWYRGLFNPLGLSGLQLWLDASAITGLADADPVGTWADLSGNGNDATQATAAKKPVYKVNILNGRPVVRFDGTDDELRTGDLALSQPNTLVLVGKVSIALTADQGLFDGQGTSRHLLAADDPSDDWRIFAGNLLASANAVDTSFHVFTAIYDGASSLLRKEGTQILSGNAGAQALGVATIGALAASVNFLNGDIAEVIVYNRALSTAEQQRVERYLSVKYGIALG